MEIDQNNSSPQTNSQAILSLVFGILTVISFCIGAIPFIPTGFICFPLSFFFGILALIFGVIALNQIRQRNESGSSMAWMGIVVGGIIFLCVVCMALAFISLFIFAPNYVPSQPFFDSYQL